MKTLRALFTEEYEEKAPAELETRVLRSIAREAERTDRRDRIVWGAFSGVSLGFFAWSMVYATDVFSKSSFGSYFSLIFSDFGSVAHLWRELGLSLLDSLPVAGVAGVLASAIFVLWSVRKYSRPSNTLITNMYAEAA